MNIFIWMIVSALRITLADAVCTFPEFLRNTNWTDSDKGALQFSDAHMTGWDFMSIYEGSTVFQEWECYHNESGSYATLILKCRNTLVGGTNSLTFRPFLCLRMNALTQYSYYYYINAPEQTNLYHERINVLLETTVSTITDPQSEICNFVPANYTANEYHVLIKEGHAADTIQPCPSSFFGVYSYNITDLGSSSTSCGTGDERLDVCTDRQRMTVNYTLCKTPLAYSANGSVFCVVSPPSGSYILHTVYNEDDTVDDVKTYRFTCFVSSLGSDGSVTTSQSPKSCTKTQTPDTQPTLTDGTVVGLNLVLTPIALASDTNPDNTDNPEDSSSTATGAIVGGVVGGVALIAILAILAFFCHRFSILSFPCKLKSHEVIHTEAKEKKKTVDSYSKDSIVKGTVDDKNVIIEPEHPTEMAPTEQNAHSSFSRLSNGKAENQDMNNEGMPFNEKVNHRNQILKSDLLASLSAEDTAAQKTPEKQRQTEGAQTDSLCGVTGSGRIENTTTCVSIVCAGTNESTGTTDMPLENKSNKPVEFTGQKCETVDEVQSTSIQQKSNTSLTYDGTSGQRVNSKIDDVQVARIKQADKSQRLNSTESIFADCDAATTYKSDKGQKSEKKEPFKITSRNYTFLGDDSRVKADSVSRQSAKVLPITKQSSSGGTLVEKVNLERSQSEKRHSFKSILNTRSVQRNFSYDSPYALTLEQKQAAARRRIENQNRKKMLQKRKLVREETKKQENAVAFQRWSERKRQETSLKLKEARSAPATNRLYKYK